MVDAMPRAAGPGTRPATGRGLAIAGAAALAAIVAAFAYFFWPWAHVPDIAGRTEAVAEAAIDRSGLHWQRREEPSDKAVPGTVVRTSPAPGRMVGAGAVITLVIAVPVRIAVPLVITGEEASEAAAELGRLGFRSRRQEEPSETAAPGTVIDASPAPGQLIEKGAIVTLSIAVPVRVAVPRLVGQSKAAAGVALDRIGLRWQPQDQPSATAAPGTVVAMLPPPGRMLDKGSVVTLGIAVPVRIAVPPVLGRAEAEAEAALNEAGFKWRRQSQPADKAAPGSVVGASPAGGEIAEKGSVVSLLIAVPVAIPVPSVAGEAVADATAAIARSGLKWQRQDVATDAMPSGTVIASAPPAAQLVDKGSFVVLRVAAAVTIQVPRVAGKKLAEATAALGRAGLRPQRKDVASDKAAPGRVIATLPAEGDAVRKGATVTLLVVKAAPTVRPAVIDRAPRLPSNAAANPAANSAANRAPPAYTPPPPSNLARAPGGYPNAGWQAPGPTAPSNAYSGAYGGHPQETPGLNWLQQTGPLSGADLVGHLYDNAHR